MQGKCKLVSPSAASELEHFPLARSSVKVEKCELVSSAASELEAEGSSQPPALQYNRVVRDLPYKRKFQRSHERTNICIYMNIYIYIYIYIHGPLSCRCLK